jgi:hypothetical protein
VGDIDTVVVDSLKALDLKRPIREADIIQRTRCLLLMLWTAPTLRHQGAIGWLRRNEPL